jgi:hypothetical protein
MIADQPLATYSDEDRFDAKNVRSSFASNATYLEISLLCAKKATDDAHTNCRVYHFSPPYNLPRRFLDRARAAKVHL